MVQARVVGRLGEVPGWFDRGRAVLTVVTGDGEQGVFVQGAETLSRLARLGRGASVVFDGRFASRGGVFLASSVRPVDRMD